jgi:hypothetical protein
MKQSNNLLITFESWFCNNEKCEALRPTTDLLWTKPTVSRHLYQIVGQPRGLFTKLKNEWHKIKQMASIIYPSRINNISKNENKIILYFLLPYLLLLLLSTTLTSAIF